MRAELRQAPACPRRASRARAAIRAPVRPAQLRPPLPPAPRESSSARPLPAGAVRAGRPPRVGAPGPSFGRHSCQRSCPQLPWGRRKDRQSGKKRRYDK
ncbi:hypothetical protein GQ55_8G029500 [Panicum hallii var. hallii]|uniref:Uncharacterized protein n=1 Tax=Panicum hallii var. hallii TaxID=1504633 RepID=A0A2T7CK38_9POAL|nr:hypothetical protein GQ55_8G029500 [Panicum hallii var. hallii]